MIYKAIGNKTADTVLYPIEQPFPKTPKDYGITYQDVEFFTRDNVKLSGWLLNESASNVYETLSVEKEMYWMEEPTHRFDGYNWFYDHPQKMLEWFEKHI